MPKRKGGRKRKTGQRHPCGKLVQEPIKPTDELLRHKRRDGPTCVIQWAVWDKRLTEDQGRAVEIYAGLRMLAGLAGREYQTALKQFIPETGDGETSEERQAWAMEQIRGIERHLTDAESNALKTAAEHERPQDGLAFATGAEVLRLILIDGVDCGIKVA